MRTDYSRGPRRKRTVKALFYDKSTSTFRPLTVGALNNLLQENNPQYKVSVKKTSTVENKKSVQRYAIKVNGAVRQIFKTLDELYKYLYWEQKHGKVPLFLEDYSLIGVQYSVIINVPQFVLEGV